MADDFMNIPLRKFDLSGARNANPSVLSERNIDTMIVNKMPKAVVQMRTVDIDFCLVHMLALSESPKSNSEIWRRTRNAPKMTWRFRYSCPSNFLCLRMLRSSREYRPGVSLKELSHCFPNTAPNAAKTLNARLAYESVCVQAVEEGYVVDEERLLMFAASVPLAMMLISCSMRTFVVSPVLG